MCPVPFFLFCIPDKWMGFVNKKKIIVGFKVDFPEGKNMKNKGTDEDCFSDCWLWDQGNKLKMKLTEGDSLDVSSAHPPCKILIFSLLLDWYKGC